MCGIVGLFIKTPELEQDLGRLLSGMLETMSDRGPDSAGFAIYGADKADLVKLTLSHSDPAALERAAAELNAHLGYPTERTTRSNHLIVSVRRADEEKARAFATAAGLRVVGAGKRMEIFKEVGLPIQVAEQFGLSGMSGTHGIGHTRMATESAVTTNGAHPFSTGRDQCLVHNGSLSNHNSVRRELKREGLSFETENDSEVAAGYLTWRMREGASLRMALEDSLKALDGFYTFVVGTENGFAVLRDPVSCKPAVMAETKDYVAFGSEYRALAGLPGIESAHIFEPEPAKVYAWERA
ncbi:glutamine amidotransferase family protein [Bosea sp. 685]|uniref:class II glutamine amidotransferase n=1 Tax=Bosea sp. 685 TaxID=3080057 RepID=UPI002892A943|nr:glutamine amidotransferase family protein [Bosea sp. 685]WNJ89633.1 glutamine amidotransferase family protein [Bosea sp. 685]